MEPGCKSRFGYFFFCMGGLVSWTSAVSTRVLSSSTEAEVNGLVYVGKENIWQRNFMKVFGFFDKIPPTLVYQDNESAIALAEGHGNNNRSKHFHIEFESFREYVKLDEIELEHMGTNDLAADMLTKNLTHEKFSRFRDEVMGEKALQEHCF